MGMISAVLSYARKIRNGANVSDVKHDPGGGALETGEHFQPANMDSAPLPGDYTVTTSVQRTGGEVAVGFIDPAQAQTANPGEFRAYSRSAGGTQVAQVYLMNDGTVEMSNAIVNITALADGTITAGNGPGLFNMAPDGTVTINNVIITPDGAVSSPASMTAPAIAAGTSLTKAGVEVADQQHTHGPGTYVAGGDSVAGVSSPSNG